MQATDPEYAWVTRHTWQSWRERYKKNSQRLDTLIQAIVEQKKPTLGEKGQYGYVRKPEEKPKRSRRRKDDGSNAGPTNDDDFLQAGPSHQLAMAMHISLATQDGHPHAGMPVSPPVPVELYLQGHPHLHNLPPHVNPIQATADGPVGLRVGQDNVVVVRKSPAEEEMEDEEPEWEVKVGHEPPPAWAAKRKAGEDPIENGKRPRVKCVWCYVHSPPAIATDQRSLARKPIVAPRRVEFNQTAQSYTLWTEAFWISRSSFGSLLMKSRSITTVAAPWTGQEHASRRCVRS